MKDRRGYYKAVNMLKTKCPTSIWDVCSLYPDLSLTEISESLAHFFNAISQEYEPIPSPEQEDNNVVYLEPYQVSARLKSFKKPKGLVAGDIDPQLLNKYHDILAIPLTIVFNQVLNTLHWPKLWKSESVTIIPKNNAPSGPGELRNLSCTPVFSKLLESFVLERLKGEISLSSRQFGGIKGCSTDHFLIETWDAIISALEDGNTAANLLSVDFAKAFNRMDHLHCLHALDNLGASPISLGWTAAFLHDRTMSVKVKGVRSGPRSVPGGSPQGSILGNFLFCATTDAFSRIELPAVEPHHRLGADVPVTTSPVRVQTNIVPPTPATAVSTPTTRGQFADFRPPLSLLNLSGEYQSDEEEFQFFRIRNRLAFDSSSEEENDNINVSLPDTLCPDPVVTMVYIDDYNSIEKIRLSEAESHISVRKRKLNVLAQKSERIFQSVKELATDINMRVNDQKTQLLCIHANKNNEVKSYIRSCLLYTSPSPRDLSTSRMPSSA